METVGTGSVGRALGRMPLGRMPPGELAGDGPPPWPPPGSFEAAPPATPVDADGVGVGA